ncbi:hypothetical protein ATCCBAA256_16380, partial [Mycobacterium montefiorense]
DTDGVVAGAGGDDPMRGDNAERGFDADQIVECGGNPNRSRGVGADADIGDSQRDGDCGTGTGTSRDQVRMARIAHGSIRTAGAGQTTTELVEVRLAEDDSSRIPESLDGDRGGCRLVGELSARRGGR